MIDLDATPRIERRWWIAGHLTLWPAIRGPLRLRREGRENIPARGPVLVVSNHISGVDPPVIGVACLPRRSFYMAKIELFRIPVLRRIIHRMGAFPVERGGADRRALRLAREILGRGDLLLMFPEGTRSDDGRLRSGLPGAGALGLEPGVTVIPAAIWGSRRPLGGVRVVFGPPVDMSGIEGSRRLRSQVAVERMMEAIAALVPRAGGPVVPAPGAVGDADG